MQIFSRIFFELSQGNLALQISVISFLMSLTSWIRVFFVERKNIRLSIQFFRKKNRTAYMYLMIENKSRLPIAVSNIEMVQGNKKIGCVQISKEVITNIKKAGGKIIGISPVYSTQLPVQMSGLSAVSCIVLFEDIPLEIPPTSTHLNFEVSTNRGKKVKKKLQLPAGWASRNDIP